MLKFSVKAVTSLALALAPQLAAAAVYTYTLDTPNDDKGYATSGTVTVDNQSGKFTLTATTTPTGQSGITNTISGYNPTFKQFTGLASDVFKLDTGVTLTGVTGGVTYTGQTKTGNGQKGVLTRFDTVTPVSGQDVTLSYEDGNKFNIQTTWTNGQRTTGTSKPGGGQTWEYSAACISPANAPEANSKRCGPSNIDTTSNGTSNGGGGNGGGGNGGGGNGGGGNGGGTTGQPVPEPGVAGLFLLGSLGLLFSQRRRIQLAPHRA